MARADGASIFLKRKGLAFVWQDSPAVGSHPSAPLDHFLGLSFIGTSRDTGVVGENLLPGKTNYLLGRDPRKWRINVPHYASVRYAGLYPGVSADFYSGSRGLEYDLFLSPGANLRAISLRADGAQKLNLRSDGAVDLLIGGRKILMRRPVIYQPDGNKRLRVSGGYRLTGSRSFGFVVGKHRANLPLVIDPSMSITFTSFLGGAGAEKGNSVVVDSSGNVYVGGSTTSPGTFPETATLSQVPSQATSNLFAAKINMSTNPPSLVYLTFIGGSGEDDGGKLALDNSTSPPRLAIVGWSTSGDFPVTDGSFLNGASDLTITKLNGAGNAFIYSKYFGGSSAEASQGYAGIATDAAGDVFVASDTTSVDLPQPTSANGYQTAFEAGTTPGTDPATNDGFLAEFAASTPAPGALVYSTYFGINATVAATGVAVDPGGNVYLAGYTSQPNEGTFPTLNGFESSYGGGAFDAFLLKINPKLSGAASLDFATFLGGSGSDQALGLALDSASPPDIYVTGATSSPNLTSIVAPTNASFQSSLAPSSAGNAFLAVVTQASLPVSLEYISYLGGTANDSGLGIAVISPSDVLIAGSATSPDFPVLCSLQGFSGAEDAFVAAFNPTVGGTSSLLYDNLLGGSVNAEAHAVAADPSGNAILFGDTLSPDYPLATHSGTGFQPICTSCGASPPLSDAFLTSVQTGSTPQACVAFDPAAAYLGAANVGSQTAVPFDGELINDGNQTLHLSGLSIVGTNQSDFSLSIDTCPAASPLAPGADCSFEIDFTPTIGGKEFADLQVTDDGVGSPQWLTLSGTGNAPGATLSPTYLNFGNVPQGAASFPGTVTLKNSGNQPLSIESVEMDPAIGTPIDFAISQPDSCSSASPLQPNDDCTVSVTFRPPGTGSVTAQLDITDNANGKSGSEQTIALAGTGTPPMPVVNLAPASLSFGSQTVGTATAPHQLTLTNTGTSTLSISRLSIAGADAADFQLAPVGTTCQSGGPGVAANGGSCAISVEFSPQLPGARNAQISITDNATPSAQSVPLSGTGTASGASLSVSSLSFAPQNIGTSSAPKKVTLLNGGTGPLTISRIAFTGADPSDFTQSNNCPSSSATLSSGASCIIEVAFAPAAAGSLSASLSFSDNAAGSPQSVSLAGDGVSSAVQFAPSSLQFPATLVATSATAVPVTVTNLTSDSLIVSGISFSGVNAGDFQETDSCKSAAGGVAAGGKCTINVAFLPQAAGTRAATLSLADSATGSPQTMSVSGSATDFQLGPASGSSTSASVGQSEPAQFDLQVTPIDGFTGNVSLACANVPSGGSCTVSTSSVAINWASPVSFTATVMPPAQGLIATPDELLGGGESRPRVPWFALLLLTAVTFYCLARRATKHRIFRPIALATALLLSSCAGGGGGSASDPQPVTYAFTVTGSSSGATRPLTLTVTIQP